MMNQELSLRIAAPKLYEKMTEVFARYHIHPYDAQGTVKKNSRGLDVNLRFASAHTPSMTIHINMDQAKKPDEDVTRFFEQAAEKCKEQLVADYFKMIKM